MIASIAALFRCDPLTWAEQCRFDQKANDMPGDHMRFLNLPRFPCGNFKADVTPFHHSPAALTGKTDADHALAPGAHIDLIETTGIGSFLGLFPGAATAGHVATPPVTDATAVPTITGTTATVSVAGRAAITHARSEPGRTVLTGTS